jgi:hypothetical protein
MTQSFDHKRHKFDYFIILIDKNSFRSVKKERANFIDLGKTLKGSKKSAIKRLLVVIM